MLVIVSNFLKLNSTLKPTTNHIPFFDQIHDTFTQKLSEKLQNGYGT